MDFESVDGAEVVDQIFVLDIPFASTAEEAQRLLAEPYERGYYIHRALEWTDGARVVYVRRAKAAARTSDTRETRAMEFLRANREMPATQLSAAFKAIGFPRSVGWVSEKRAEVIRAERRALTT